MVQKPVAGWLRQGLRSHGQAPITTLPLVQVLEYSLRWVREVSALVVPLPSPLVHESSAMVPSDILHHFQSRTLRGRVLQATSC